MRVGGLDVGVFGEGSRVAQPRSLDSSSLWSVTQDKVWTTLSCGP